MPTVVNYEQVLTVADRMRLRSVYYNSGAFDFGSAPTHIVGWLGPDDPTLRSDLQALTARVSIPYARNLSTALMHAWRTLLPGTAWVLPKSHWSFELQHAHRPALHAALRALAIDVAHLSSLPSAAAALAFEPDEANALGTLVETIFTENVSSDFALLFPDRPAILTLHHHQQIWLQTTDPILAQQWYKFIL
jgi:hypothetical protein